MAEVLLARHAKSYANARNPAFGNRESPLDNKGIGQCKTLLQSFREEYDIDPSKYGKPVASSEYLRPRETAERVGFAHIDAVSVINESTLPPGMLKGRQIVERHARERWAPDEVRERAAKFMNLVREGDLAYQIYFTHGLFIASVLLELEAEEVGSASKVFDNKRGFIPDLATITPVEL